MSGGGEAWEIFCSLKNFLKDRYGINNNDFDLEKGYVIAEGEKTLQINRRFSGGHIFVRILQSRAGGSMEFILNNKQLLFTTVSDDEVLVWKDLGVYPEITKIEIKSAGPINMINAIASVSEPEYGQLITKAKTIISTSKIVTDLKNLSDSTSNLPDVPYSKVSQTEYKIEKSKMRLLGLCFLNPLTPDGRLMDVKAPRTRL